MSAPPPRRPIAPLAPTLALGGALLAACANLSSVYVEVDTLVEAGDYARAAELVAGSDEAFGARSGLLQQLELATLLHLAERWDESNQAFERAKRMAEASYTRSLSLALASWTLNDRVLEYPGEVFERALIHVFSAINYRMLRRPDSALVEVRQLDFLLRSAAEQSEGRTYREDAFGRMLSGMLYEESSDWDDAYIAYWKALEAYEDWSGSYGVETPDTLLRAATRAARRMGPAQLEELRERWGRPDGRRPLASGHGRLAILHYNGPAPRKVEQILDLSFGEAWAYVNVHTTEGLPEEQVHDAIAIAAAIPASDTVRVAFPRFAQQPFRVERLEVALPAAARAGPAELVQDVGAIAVRDLEDRIVAVRAKAIARAALKYALAKAVSAAARQNADEQGAALIGLGAALLRMYQVASERADVRSWRGLPSEIWLLEAQLPAGEHELELAFVDASGTALERRREVVRIRPDARSFLIVRSVR